MTATAIGCSCSWLLPLLAAASAMTECVGCVAKVLATFTAVVNTALMLMTMLACWSWLWPLQWQQQ